MVFAFDFFGTLETHETVRALARGFAHHGHDVHIVTAVSPGLPIDNDEWYAAVLVQLGVPFKKIWRVDHKPELKVAVLERIGAVAFWDDVKENVDAARRAGFSVCHVGVDDPTVTCHHVEQPCDVCWRTHPTPEGIGASN